MAKMETLVANFDNNALNGWLPLGVGTATVANGEIEITTTGASGDYAYLQSPTTYDLTGSYAFVRLVSAGSQAANFDTIPLAISLDGNNDVHFDINSNNMATYQKVATVQTVVGSTTTYNALIHRYLRIRENGGIIFFEYSTDGRAWISFNSVANPFAITSVNAFVMAGSFGVVAASTLKVDNFNYSGRLYTNNSILRPHPFSPGLAR